MQSLDEEVGREWAMSVGVKGEYESVKAKVVASVDAWVQIVREESLCPRRAQGCRG